MNFGNKSGTFRSSCWLLIVVVVSCCLVSSVSVAGAIPESTRSRAVIAKARPLLIAALQGAGLELGSPVFIRIFKESKELEVWMKEGPVYRLFRTYPICYYSGELGPKKQEGDSQAPEGFYYITPGQLNPWSQFHLSMNVGYPNRYDRVHGYTGGALMIHGDCVSIGCFAMTDQQIEEIYTVVHAAFEGGQQFVRTHIFPFRMTTEKLKSNADESAWSFWRNLKVGYDWFEQRKTPPNVNVKARLYVFSDERLGT